MEKKKGNLIEDLMKILTNKNLLIVLLISCCNAMGQFACKTPVNVYGKSLGLTVTALGAIATIHGIGKMVFRPVAGFGADRITPKYWLMICCGVRLATFIVYAATNNVVGYIIGRILEGASYALIGTAMYTIVSVSVDKRALGTAIALFVTIPKLFQMAMPTLAMMLYEGKGESAPYWVASITMAVAIVLCMFFNVPSARAPKPAGKKQEKKKGFALSNFIAFKGLWYLPMMWANSAILATEDLLVVVYATALGHGVAGGLYFTIKSAVTLIMNIPMGTIADRYGDRYVIYFGFFCKAMAFILIALFPSPWAFMVAGGLSGAGYPAQNVMQTQAIKIMPRSQAGIASSTHLLMTDIGVMLLSPVVGYVAETFSNTAVFWIFGGIGAMGIVAYALLRKKLEGMVEEAMRIDAAADAAVAAAK